MFIIYCPPCGGKSTALKLLREEGFRVGDTDDLLSANVNSSSKEKDDALNVFAQTREDEFDFVFTNLIDSLERTKRTPDLAFCFEQQEKSVSGAKPSILATRFYLRNVINNAPKSSYLPEDVLTFWDTSTYARVQSLDCPRIVLCETTFVSNHLHTIRSLREDSINTPAITLGCESTAASFLVIYCEETNRAVLQDNPKYGYHLLGGKAEDGETPIESLVRELKEEIPNVICPDVVYLGESIINGYVTRFYRPSSSLWSSAFVEDLCSGELSQVAFEYKLVARELNKRRAGALEKPFSIALRHGLSMISTHNT